jgi:hypothetical protein
LIFATKEPLVMPLLKIIPTTLAKEAMKSFDDLMLYAGMIKNSQFDKDKEKEKEEKEKDGNGWTVNNSILMANLAASFINRGVTNPQLREEIFCQLIKQLNRNDEKASRDLIWDLLYLTLHFFVPYKQMEKFLVKFLHDQMSYFLLPDLKRPRETGDKSEDIVYNDEESALSAQLCLDTLHSHVLYIGGSGSAKKKGGVYGTLDRTSKTVILANEKVHSLLTNMRKQTRQYNVHIQHQVFHQVNRKRSLLLQSKTPAAQETLAEMDFELPPYYNADATSQFSQVPLYQYYLPKVMVYLAMKVLSLDGLNTEVC